MTDVAQAAAVVDMDGVTSKDEHNISDAEKEDDDNNESKEKKDILSQVTEGETHHITQDTDIVCEAESSKVDETPDKDEKHKENGEEEQVRTEAQDTENQENEDLNISDLALKKKVGGKLKLYNLL